MKKGLIILLSSLFILIFTSCTNDVSNEEEKKETNTVGIPNPFVEMTKEEWEAEYGPSFLPDRATDVIYAHIKMNDNDTDGINQIEFSVDGIEYSFRYMVGEYQDISGMYYTWTYTNDDDDSIYKIQLSDEGTGISSWYVNGINYNISMIADATKERLCEMSDQYYDFYKTQAK